MKVLWITNVFVPQVLEDMKQPSVGSGSWLVASMEALISQYDDLEIAMATTFNCSSLIEGKSGKIKYYTIPMFVSHKSDKKELESLWQQINASFRPDVVHIHGTEYEHGLSYIKACGAENVVISVQGLISVIARYAMGGLTRYDILKNSTFHECITRFFWNYEKQLKKRSETDYYMSSRYVIGRTLWDKVHVLSFNPNLEYFHCNETLRSLFYDNSWNIEACNKHTIFFSQAAKPFKGLHMLLKALPLVLKVFPDARVRIAGSNFLKNDSFRDKLRFTSYAHYIRRLIVDSHLSDTICFTGLLNEVDMLAEYLNAHAFVCASSIENSSNSIAEAQILGVPCIASYVGGTPSIIENEETGLLYRFEEYEMLAYHLIRVFSDNNLASKLSEKERVTALKRHDRETNASTTYNIYKKIIEK